MTPYYQDDSVTIYHGDCLEIVPSLIGSFAVITDPPYGVNHHPGLGRMSKVAGGIVGDEAPPNVRWMTNFPSVIWGGNNFCDQLPRSTGWLVWDKTNGEKCEHSQAELAWTNLVRTIRIHRENYSGFMRGRDGWFHQHQKPTLLFSWCLQWVPDGLTILDPYLGSGTCLIAAKNRGMQAVGIEIQELDCEIAAKRMSQGVLPLGVR